MGKQNKDIFVCSSESESEIEQFFFSVCSSVNFDSDLVRHARAIIDNFQDDTAYKSIYDFCVYLYKVDDETKKPAGFCVFSVECHENVGYQFGNDEKKFSLVLSIHTVYIKANYRSCGGSKYIVDKIIDILSDCLIKLANRYEGSFVDASIFLEADIVSRSGKKFINNLGEAISTSLDCRFSSFDGMEIDFDSILS